MPSSPKDPDTRSAAHRLLAERLGADDVSIVADQTATTPEGRVVRRLFGASTAHPNSPKSVVVDTDGTEILLADLEPSIGRRLFTPAVGGFGVATPERAPVTIDPTVNDLILAECSNLKERIVVTVPPTGAIPLADVYLLADTTGSMGPAIAAVKAGAAAIVGNAALSGFNVAYGVGNYRDFPITEFNPYAFQHQQSPTTVPADVLLAINAWNADLGLGGDGPEGQFWALQQIATDPAIGWRPGAKRIIVWFGDAPGHDPICAAISGAGADVTEATATAALVAAGITVLAVSTSTGYAGGLDHDPAPTSVDYEGCAVGGTPGQASRITAATPGGSLTIDVDATVIVNTLVTLIAAAVTATNSVTLVPTGATSSFVTSISPSGGYGPLAGNVEHSLTFDVGWKGKVDCSDTPQLFTGTIDVVADGIVVAQKHVRITVPACQFHHVIDMLCGSQQRLKGEDDDRRERECTTVVPGRYATAVTIYNPGPCRATIEKRFAPVLLNGKAIGREPETVQAKPFARIVLQPGEATMDDCCALEEVVRLSSSVATLGVLDIVSDHPLVVTGIYTSTGPTGAASVVHTRTVVAHRS
jgi:hypothetical protein